MPDVKNKKCSPQSHFTSTFTISFPPSLKNPASNVSTHTTTIGTTLSKMSSPRLCVCVCQVEWMQKCRCRGRWKRRGTEESSERAIRNITYTNHQIYDFQTIAGCKISIIATDQPITDRVIHVSDSDIQQFIAYFKIKINNTHGTLLFYMQPSFCACG